MQQSVPSAVPQPGAILRYNRGAVIIHWVTALLLLMQIYIGFTFSDMPRGPDRSFVFEWHRTWGVLILLLALFRLGWRMAHRPPPYPPELPRWERLAATWNHRAFYFLLIVLPLTGLMAISSGRSMTTLAGGIPFPLIPGVSEALSDRMGEVHETLVTITLVLIALHVGAALKHQFIDGRRGRAAGRMWPFKARDGSPSVEVHSGTDIG